MAKGSNYALLKICYLNLQCGPGVPLPQGPFPRSGKPRIKLTLSRTNSNRRSREAIKA